MTDKKHTFEARISFSHARTKPLVVEKIKRRVAHTALLCPTCGARMKLVPSAGSELVASCPNCKNPS
jgi:tRNA(Ile2) C34 agmatinyltransferase TiaS